MQKRIEHQTVRLTHLTQELESTKEAQRIVLDTKESVMRSLLKQNSHITQEVGDILKFMLHESIFIHFTSKLFIVA